MAQRDTNPYIYSDSNKRYMTYDWYMKRRYGGKTAKLPLDIGCTCPNLDGTKGCGGCIYCKSGSRSAVGESITEQLENARAVACRKWSPVGFIPYFQSNTNTYGDMSVIEKYFFEAARYDGAVMVDIATRADCVSPQALDVIERLCRIIPVTVELGLQTSNDSTAERINRCHTYADFVLGYSRLRSLAERIDAEYPPVPSGFGELGFRRLQLGVHIINGLPGEGEEDMMRTAADVASLHPDLVKIHLLHVLSGTAMGEEYLRGKYVPMEREEYVNIVCSQLEILHPDTVIGRVTGDGIASELLAPEWSRRKTEVANEIDKELYRRGTYQGIGYRGI